MIAQSLEHGSKLKRLASVKLYKHYSELVLPLKQKDQIKGGMLLGYLQGQERFPHILLSS